MQTWFLLNSQILTRLAELLRKSRRSKKGLKLLQRRLRKMQQMPVMRQRRLRRRKTKRQPRIRNSHFLSQLQLLLQWLLLLPSLLQLQLPLLSQWLLQHLWQPQLQFRPRSFKHLFKPQHPQTRLPLMIPPATRSLTTRKRLTQV